MKVEIINLYTTYYPYTNYIDLISWVGLGDHPDAIELETH